MPNGAEKEAQGAEQRTEGMLAKLYLFKSFRV